MCAQPVELFEFLKDLRHAIACGNPYGIWYTRHHYMQQRVLKADFSGAGQIIAA
jgi:hypothetical protein